jgi:hypothetical protein
VWRGWPRFRLNLAAPACDLAAAPHKHRPRLRWLCLCYRLALPLVAADLAAPAF